MSRIFIHLDAPIVPQKLRQNARWFFSHHSKMFFPVQNNVPIKRLKKRVFLLLESKFKWNLNELPNYFSVNIGYQLLLLKRITITSFYSEALKSDNFVMNIIIF